MKEMSPRYSANSTGVQSPFWVNVFTSSCLWFSCFVWRNTAVANAETVMCKRCSSRSNGQMISLCVVAPVSCFFSVHAEDKPVKWWVAAAVHDTRAHSVGLWAGCSPFQSKVRATYLRSPPCRNIIMSVSLSNSAVTMKDFPLLVCKRKKQSPFSLNCSLKSFF